MTWPATPSPRDTIRTQLAASLALEGVLDNPNATTAAVINAAALMMQGHADTLRSEAQRLNRLALDIEADIARLKKLAGDRL